METSWEKTIQVLKNFADVLACSKCGNNPKNPTTFTVCGHVFCRQCIKNHSQCPIGCKYVQGLFQDRLVQNLAHGCNTISKIIGDRDECNTDNRKIDVKPTYEAVVNSPAKIANKNSPQVPMKNLDKRNAKGETRLHTACVSRKQREDYIKALLAAGFDPNTKDHAGWTPLQEVVGKGYTNVCKLLLEAGAAPDMRGSAWRTALHEAAIDNRIEEAKLLLRFNANPNKRDEYNKMPIEYCTAEQKEMVKILTEADNLPKKYDKVTNLNHSLDQSFCSGQPAHTIFALDLKEENKGLLSQMVSKHKLKLVSIFRPTVTHVIVEASNQNTVKLSYYVMMAIVRGVWLLNTQWISLGIELDDLSNLDLTLFEIDGAPVADVPRRARENAQNECPSLFHGCHFHFALQANESYYIDGVEFTKKSLTNLVEAGGGTVLTREPNPKYLNEDEVVRPFHTGLNPSHPLYKCTHYIIYIPGQNEPRMKYKTMPRVKTLPLIWLIECIEKFTLIDPTHFYLS